MGHELLRVGVAFARRVPKKRDIEFRQRRGLAIAGTGLDERNTIIKRLRQACVEAWPAEGKPWPARGLEFGAQDRFFVQHQA